MKIQYNTLHIHSCIFQSLSHADSKKKIDLFWTHEPQSKSKSYKNHSPGKTKVRRGQGRPKTAFLDNIKE